MHELSIAQSILEIVTTNVPAPDLSRVRGVRVKVGEVAGVVPDSLDFCFTALVHQTDLAAASLLIEHVPYTIHCDVCNTTSRATAGFRPCPVCGASTTRILSGTELQVTEIEIQDDGQESP